MCMFWAQNQGLWVSNEREEPMQVAVHNITVCLESDCGSFTPALICKSGEQKDVYYVTLRVTASEASLLPDLKLTWILPSIDFHHKWNTRCMQNRALDVGAGSYNHIHSSANSGAPVFSLYNLAGTNACTWAASEVIHDTDTGGDYHSGRNFWCDFKVVGSSIGVVKDYEVTIRFDFRRIPYYEALADVTLYWESLPGCAPCPVPAAARKPLLSSWYVYEIRFDAEDFEKNCEEAVKIGFETAIMDDGWQTSQTTAGYENNGDWEVYEGKVPDLANQVKRIHAMGMKYMVWFSVPFVGIESKAYNRFKDMLLPGREGAKWYSFDMRFPEVRDYLVGRFVGFVERYGVDGLKMDFIGSCNDNTPDADIMADGRRDCPSIGEGMCKLLNETTSKLRVLNPDILIEFRQAYTGPAMRAYGNMLRAVDCANSLGDNRVRTLDLRLLAGNTAVHADPITWHDEDPDHSAAMQIIHALFSVPQISRRISELTPSHRAMLKQQLKFVKAHEDVLQLGEIRPLYPHLLYPLVVARNDHKMVVAFYADMPARLGEEELPPELLLVNGSYASQVMLELGRDYGAVEAEIIDCCGARVRIEKRHLNADLHSFSVPPAGHVQIKQQKA
jgi:alpha-galactosidase